jgi:uncharacterized repeat protein (TIGR01451 family)
VTDAIRPRQRITLRLRAHRGVARVTSLLLVLTAAGAGLTAGATLAAAAITTPFAQIYSINTTGDIQIRGNTLMTCQTAVADCTASRNTAGGGTASNGLLNDNNYWMVNVDADSDASTFNSSFSTVDLPAGASVLYAGLVWGGRPGVGGTIGGVAGVAAPTPADTGKVKLKAPGQSSYSDLTASSTATNSGNYQSFVDVTSIVQAGGNGSYSVANVQSGQGGDSYAGWGLAIAYSDPSAPPRNLTIFRGYGSVGSGESFDIPVSGFTTPPSGAVQTTLGAVSYEGDLGSTGDQLLLGPSSASLTNIHDALHASTNVFNSTISDKGVDLSTRSPKYKNQLGFDAATFDASGMLPNSATTADIRVTSSSETYYPGLITFATDLYAPELNATKTEALVAKATGNTQTGVLEPGDTLEYTIDATNGGHDAAKNTVLTDAVPAGTTYLSNSLSAGGVSLTDAPGDDIGSFNSVAKSVTVNLGSGATSSAGGKVLIGASTSTVKFRVTANASIANNQNINNVAAFSYASDLAGTVLTGASNAVTIPAVRHHSALSITKSADLPRVQRGASTSVTYTLTATNSGPYDEPAASVTDTLPSGATFGTVTPSAGSCSAPAGQTVTCHLGSLINGGTATVAVHALLDGSADPATDTATVSGTNLDSNASDDSATRSTIVNTAPVATADAATTANGVATINVRANDTDADGDALSVSAPGATAPAKGTVVVNPNNTVTYTATAGAAGTDTFSYAVDDGRGGTATAVVTMTIPNAAPHASDDTTSTTIGNPVTVRVLTNDTDPNIPTVPSQHLAVTGVTQPAGGEGAVTTDGTTVTFTPAASFIHGSTTIGYTISDGAGGTATAAVTVTMANVDPVAATDTAATACITPVDIDVLANDSDPNNDTLTVTAVTGATHGTATITATGQVHYAPNPAWSGADVLHYTLSDGTTTVTGQLTVTTSSCAPTANPFSLTVDGGSTTNIDVLTHTTDPDSAVLTVTGTGPAGHGTVTVTPAGAVLYTPDATYAGPDSFTYTVSDADHNTATATVTLTVRNQTPAAHADATLVPVNGSVDINVLGNDNDPNGDPLTVTGVSLPSNGTAMVHVDGTVTYSPDSGFMGSDSFTYAISDGNGGTDTATVSITVANQAPVAADDNVDFTGAAGTAITIDALGNDSDPNGDPLTLSSVATPLHGTAVIAAGKVVYTPDPTHAGLDSFTYTVKDGRGGQSVATVTINIHNRAPHAVADSATTSGGSVTLDVRGNDSDADGDPLSVTAPGVTAPSRGSVSVNPNGTLTYTASAGQLGTDTFSYVLDDGRGGSDTALVTVTIPNTDPIAAADSSSTAVGTAVTVPVLDNDSDANIPSQQLSVSAVSQPAGGKGTATTNGTTVTFTPSVNFTHGSATFSYTVSDGDGGSDSATVTISIANSDPVANDDTAITSCVTAVDVDVLANDTDPNGDALTVTAVTGATHGTASIIGTGSATMVRYLPNGAWTGDDALLYTLSDGTSTVTGHLTVSTGSCAPTANTFAKIVDGGTTTSIDVLAHTADPDSTGQLTVTAGTPAHGTVTVDSSGAVLYTPDATYAGSDTFTYTVTDPDGNHATATADITVRNQSPVAHDDSTVLLVNDSADITVLSNDTDPNGDALTVTSLSAPTHGTATLHPDGSVTYQPGAFYGGSDSFTYTISDGNGGTDTATVSLTVGNGVPVAADDSATATGAGAAPMTLDVLANDTDPNGDALTLDSVSTPLHGADAIQAGKVVYTPGATFAGLDSFTYTVNDGRGGTATAVVTVSIPNTAPDATDDPTTTTPGNAVTVPVLDNDSDVNSSQTLAVSSVTQPAGGEGTVTTDGTGVTFTPASTFTHGSTTFDYTVTDGAGGTATATVTVTMANVDPVALSDTAVTRCITAVVVDVLANDSDANGDNLTLTGVTSAHGTATIVGSGAGAKVRYLPDGAWSGADVLHYSLFDGTTTVTGQLTITTGSCDPVANPFTQTVPGGTTTSVDVLTHTSDPDSAGHLIVSTGLPTHGTVILGLAGTLLYTPTPGYAGPDTFSYTVTDPEGNTATATVTLSVGNQAPTAHNDSVIATGAAGSPATFDLLANDIDPNGDALTITAVTTPAYGTAVVSGNQVVYTPAATYVGPDTFTYTISDGNGGVDTSTATIDVRNRAPHAAPDTATTPVGIATLIDAIANDDDPDSEVVTLSSAQATSAHGGTVTVTSGGLLRYLSANGFTGVDTFTYLIADARGGTDTGTVAVTVTNAAPVAQDIAISTPGGQAVVVNLLGSATDSDGQPLHVVSTGPAMHGTVSLDAAGRATYTPGPGFVGTDSYSYVVSDGQGGVATATVTVTVGNVAPNAVDDAATTSPGKAVVVSVLDNDSDPNTPFLGQGLHVTGVAVTSGKATASVTTDGQVRVVPTGKYTGVIVVTYTIADGSGATATATLSVSVTATPTSPQSLDQSITLVPAQKSAVIDPTAAVTGHGSVTLSTVQHPGHGVTVTVKGDKLFVHRTGEQTGTVTFTYVVVGSDGVHVTVTETVHVLGLTAHNPVGTQASVLPHTGADVLPAGILGIALTVAGALACLFASRRKEES